MSEDAYSDVYRNLMAMIATGYFAKTANNPNIRKDILKKLETLSETEKKDLAERSIESLFKSVLNLIEQEYKKENPPSKEVYNTASN